MLQSNKKSGSRLRKENLRLLRQIAPTTLPYICVSPNEAHPRKEKPPETITCTVFFALNECETESYHTSFFNQCVE